MSSSGHPNAERLLRGFGAFIQRDLEALHELFAPDVRWEIPGGSSLAGTYVGVDEVLAMLGRTLELSGGTYRTDLEFVLADDEHAVASYRASGRRDGDTLDQDQVLVCRFADDRIAEVRALPADQAAFDRFWR
jgi:ketosteroid isomerase-like protein